MSLENLHIETIAARGAKGYDETTGAISFPIYQSATFRHPALNETTGYDYSRLQNPTREEVENIVAKLEGGKEGLAFSTGMAAITTLITTFEAGDHVVVSEDLYGGTFRLFNEIFNRFKVEVTFVDTTDIENTRAAIKENTVAILVETPSNPCIRITDLRATIALAKEHKLLSIVDNTFLTPYFQRPLSLGADVVVHSGTKFLGGHNDTLAGFIVANDAVLIEKLRLVQRSTGAVLSPFDSWLLIRGIKTLPLRLEKQQENAIKIAKWLVGQPQIEKVFYPGLETHPGYDLNKSQASGFGAMISFIVKDEALVEQILGRVKLIFFAESLGGVETLITYPKVQTHAAIPEAIRNRVGVTDKLLRISVGIENVEDLIADLSQALA